MAYLCSANLDAVRCKDEFYLRAIKRFLLQQNQEILSLIPGKPVFDIEVPAACASSLFAQKEALLQLLSGGDELSNYYNYNEVAELRRYNSFSRN